MRVRHPLHDVLVGEQVAVRGHHDARAGAAAGLFGLIRAADINADHRRPHLLHRAHHGGGVGIQGFGRRPRVRA